MHPAAASNIGRSPYPLPIPLATDPARGIVRGGHGFMQQRQHVTARGTGIWGGQRYDVELTTTTTTWSDSRGDRTETLVSHELRCSAPAGWRHFGSDASARDAFIGASFSELDLRNIDPPELREPAQPFDSILGERLSSVEFVADYVQLRFDSPPLNLYVWPRIHSDGVILRRPDAGYVDALVGLVGHRFVAADELLDLGLVLDFDDATRLAVPLDGTDADGAEAAEFTGDPGGAWSGGDTPFSSFAAT
jgi:hypothetical protein